jgi:hypothetical protein
LPAFRRSLIVPARFFCFQLPSDNRIFLSERTIRHPFGRIFRSRGFRVPFADAVSFSRTAAFFRVSASECFSAAKNKTTGSLFGPGRGAIPAPEAARLTRERVDGTLGPEDAKRAFVECRGKPSDA